MKRTLIILGILVVLGGAFAIVTSTNEPSDVRSPWKIPAAPTIASVEVERPDPSGEGRQILRIERQGEEWRITSPVQAELAPVVARKIGSIFNEPIEMDDLELSSKDLTQYGLDEANRFEIRVVVPNGEPIEFVAGTGMRIAKTGAKRTYVLGPRGNVYRARTDLGILFAQPLSRLRARGIFSMEPDEIELIRIESPGQETYEFVADGTGTLNLTQPQPSFELEPPLVRSMVTGLANLRVRRFLEGGRTANEFDEPTHVVTLGTQRGDRVIQIKRIDKGENETATFLAAMKGDDDVFELMPALGGIVTGGRNVLRKKLTREIGRDQIARIELPGEAGVVLEQRDGEWRQIEPIEGDVNRKEMSKFIGNLEMLTAIRYGDRTRQEAGLDPSSNPDTVVITDKSGDVSVLLLGNSYSEGQLYWAAWQDGEDVFLLPKYLYDRLHPGAEELLLKEEP